MRTSGTPGTRDEAPRKKKSLEHPKKLTDGTDPSHEFWIRAIRHKLTVDDHETPTAGEQVGCIVTRREGKAAEHLEAHLRASTYDGNTEGLLGFLKTLFDDPHRQLRSERQFRRLYMKKDDKFSEFFLKLSQLAAEAEISRSSYKHELAQKISDNLQISAAREATYPLVTFDQFQAIVSHLAFVQEGLTARQQARPGGSQRYTEQGRSRKGLERKTGQEKLNNPESQGASTITPAKVLQCYRCQGTNHIARNCKSPSPVPQKTTVTAVKREEAPANGNGSPGNNSDGE